VHDFLHRTNDCSDAGFRRHLDSAEVNFRCQRGFVRAVNAGEIDELATAGLGVETLYVAAFAFFQWRVDKDLDELSGIEEVPRHFPLTAEGGNKSDNDDQTGIHHKLGDLGDSTNIFDPVSLGESKIPIEPMADIITIENVSVFAFGMEALFQQVGNRGFSRTGETGQPEAARFLMLDHCPRGLGDLKSLPVNIAGST